MTSTSTLKRGPLGGTDLTVSALCLGAGPFGTSCRGPDLDRLINAYRDADGNFLDTAHSYAVWLPNGDGASERAIGDYTRRNGAGDLVIATKGGHPPMAGYRRTDAWLSPARIAADIDDSLARLGCDTIDLYWLHRDDTRLAAGEIVETLNGEIRRGRIRFIGASNWSAARIAAANLHASAHGLHGFVASQSEWNLSRKNIPPDALADTSGTAMRFATPDDVAWHRRERFTLIPYTSGAGGYFASDGRRCAETYGNPVSRARLNRCRELAATVGAAPGQVALAWLLNQNFPVIPIVGTTNPEHLEQAMGATSLSMTPAQVRWLSDDPEEARP